MPSSWWGERTTRSKRRQIPLKCPPSASRTLRLRKRRPASASIAPEYRLLDGCIRLAVLRLSFAMPTEACRELVALEPFPLESLTSYIRRAARGRFFTDTVSFRRARGVDWNQRSRAADLLHRP